MILNFFFLSFLFRCIQIQVTNFFFQKIRNINIWQEFTVSLSFSINRRRVYRGNVTCKTTFGIRKMAFLDWHFHEEFIATTQRIIEWFIDNLRKNIGYILNEWILCSYIFSSIYYLCALIIFIQKLISCDCLLLLSRFISILNYMQ